MNKRYIVHICDQSIQYLRIKGHGIFSVPFCNILNQYKSITLISNRLWVSNDTIQLLQIVQMVERGALLYFSTTNWLLGYITDCMPLSFKQNEKLNKPLN